jgi:acyl dehydratase
MEFKDDEVYVGKDIGGREIEITPALVANYIRATGDANPIYTGRSAQGGPVAPALILVNEVYAHPGWYLPNFFGNLHAKQEWEIFRPVPVGAAVRTRCTVIDRYVKRDRDYIVNEASLFDAQGRLCCRGRTHQSFLRDADPQTLAAEAARKQEKPEVSRAEGARADFNARSGSKRAKERPPHPATIEGAKLEPIARTITLEMSRAFSGPSENYHTNEEMAKQLGFPKVIVQGMLSTCLVSELMTRVFGAGWMMGGRMSVNLTGIVWVDDAVTTRGTITGVEPEGAHRRVSVAVWAEKPDGTLTVAGTASALSDGTEG